jgi:6,7-dimethyl-8-ribityllumazine synthase
MKISVVISRFNEEVTSGLLNGVKAVFEEKGVVFEETDLFYAAGAFETPLLAKKLAKTGRYDGVICLGCVIKGDTAHFEFISGGATLGLMQASLETEVPISFGILTTYTEAQAAVRSNNGPENKGREAALACIDSIQTLEKIQKL